MKHIAFFITPLSFLFLLSGSARIPAGSNICKANRSLSTDEKGPTEKGAFLMYIGTVGGYNANLQLEMVPSIGISYTVSFSRDNSKNFLSHIGIFYKFAKPWQAVYYNYRTHQSRILKASAKAGETGPDVVVAGTQVVRKYSCTHLVCKSDSQQEDYWMSVNVPGFKTVIEKLYKADPDLVMLDVNETIFNWGGLVKATWTNKEGDYGNLELVAASENTPIPVSDFEPPKKK